MNKFTSKLVAVVSCAAVVLYAATPALATATTNLSETGNGAGSSNSIVVNNTQSQVVDQTNSYVGTTTVTASPNSGGNSVTNQTGGSTAIGTGNVSSTVDVLTQANVNEVNNNRMTSDPSKTLDISGNGALSASAITSNNTTSDSVFQNNTATVTNAVTTDPNSGNNAITNGTGGSQTIVTGHAAADVGISTEANANIATLGGSSNGNGGTTATISGNGAGSSNVLNMNSNRLMTFVQGNDTVITNAVDASPNSGNNSATNNTAGLTNGGLRIDTGNATSLVDVTNQGGVNVVSTGTGMTPSTTAAESGNGAFSSNAILSNLNDGLSLFQGAGENDGSRFLTTTAVTADPLSGINSATNDTFTTGNTSLFVTGHAMSDARVMNQGNVNLFGPSNAITLPGGMTLGFSFNLGGLFGTL